MKTIYLTLLCLAAFCARADSIYVADFYDGTIEKFDANGVGTMFAYNLDGPEQMAFDSAGNLYVANYDGNTVLKFTTNGVESIFASNSGGPNGLAFDSAGNLYVAMFNGGVIEKYAPDGTDLGVFATLNLPIVLAFDSSGNLYAGTYDNYVEKYAPDGTDLGVFVGGVNGPTGLAFNKAGNLFASNFWGDGISEFAPNGALLGTFATNDLDEPYFLAFDSTGNLYVPNLGNGTVQKFAPDGSGSTFASIDSAISVAIWPGLSITTTNALASDLKLFSTENGKFTLQFSGNSDSTFTVIASTNLVSPMSNWISLGSAIWQSNNIFQFTDVNATNRAEFYGVRSP